MDEITTVSGPIFHLEVFRIANLRYETFCVFSWPTVSFSGEHIVTRLGTF